MSVSIKLRRLLSFNDSKAKESGFTIVELNISLVIIGILSVSVLAIFTNYLVLITRNNLIADMTSDSQNLLRLMVEELRYGAGVRQTNTIADANSPSGGWNTTNSNFVVITAVPASDSSGAYIIDTATGAPYMNELVYYRQGNTLYKRILAHPDAVNNRQTTSCPTNLASPTCPADRKLIENVNTINFSLYDQDNGSTTDPLLARSVKIDAMMEKNTFGEPLTVNNSIRVTLRNRFL